MRFRRSSQPSPSASRASPSLREPPEPEKEAAGEMSKEIAEPGLPQEHRQEPIRARKAAVLMATDERIGFGPLTQSGVMYAPEGVAECRCGGSGGYVLTSG